MNPKAQAPLSTPGLSQSTEALVPDALPESETTAKISARKLVVNITLPVHNVWGYSEMCSKHETGCGEWDGDADPDKGVTDS